MNWRLFGCSVFAAATLGLASASNAATIHIGIDSGSGLSEVKSGNGFASFSGVDGNFTITSLSGQSQPTVSLPTLLDATTINAAASGGGELKLYVTASDLNNPQGLQNFITT